MLGYGPILFGASISLIARLADIRYVDIEQTLDGPQANFRLTASNTLLCFQEDKLNSIHFFESFRFNGLELFGTEIANLAGVFPNLRADDPTDEQVRWMQDRSIGLMTYFEDGRLSGAIIFDPAGDDE